MTSLQISLPESASRFIEEQVASGKYGSASDAVADLVEKARVQAAKEKLTALIREGMDSGEGAEVSDEYWARFDEKVQSELARRQSK